MNNLLKKMTYKEFKDYCCQRACDGNWSLIESVNCINIIEEVDAIKIKMLGFTMKKKTDKAREEKWNKLKDKLIFLHKM